jgi:DNA-binding response OmpR family regulator
MSPNVALVVDDNSSVRNLIAVILEREGFAVTCTGLGEDAMGLADCARLDLLVVDLMLPDTDGLAIVLMTKARHPAVRTIVMSGMPGAVSLIEAGVDAYLPKPFGVDTFLEIVQRLCPPPAASDSSASARKDQSGTLL